MMSRYKLWVGLLLALVLAEMAASVLMPLGNALTVISDMIQGALLLAGTVAFISTTIDSRGSSLHIRAFWLLMSAGMVLWLTYQGMWNYFEVLRGVDVPNPFLGDIVLFMHLVPMIAALAILPHLREEDRNENIRLLDFALLLIWWIFVYVYSVIPWLAVELNEPAYSANYNLAYLVEKVVLLGALSVLVYTSDGGWRTLYAQLLGAGTLYASSSYLANWAIARKVYYSGSIYDVPLAASMAWAGAIPLIARKLDLSDSRPPQPFFGLWVTRLSVCALFSILWAATHTALNSTLPAGVKSFRIVASLITMVIMGVGVFWRQRLLRSELSLLLERSRRSLDELKALQARLLQSEKLASLGQLVGGAAHEINNPLTAMLGYSDLLTVSDLPPEERLHALKIGEQVRRTTTLVASLLTFARQAPARLAQVDINSVLQTAARLLAPQLETDHSKINLDLASALPPVMADSNQILHVCLHLAGQVSAQLGRGYDSNFSIRTHHRNGLVLVDFYPGRDIAGPETALQSILESEGGAKPSSLSLSACCRIIEEHGGRLLQPLDPGRCAFRVELKVAAGKSRQAAAMTRSAARSGL